MNDEELEKEFLAKGIVKIPVENPLALDTIRNQIKGSANSDFLNNYHASLSLPLNEQRLHVINNLNKTPNINHLYFSLAKHAIETLVGNELVMQRNINLSIQLPNDDSSLLPIHCDTWSGDSPYEVVLWVPLVDCYDTKSMFFVDKEWDVYTQHNIKAHRNPEYLWDAVKDHAVFQSVKYGECLIFTQNIMHGNRVNETNETRWSMNCRFKSALTPYADKKLGEFFEPIQIRAATRLGISYVNPWL